MRWMLTILVLAVGVGCSDSSGGPDGGPDAGDGGPDGGNATFGIEGLSAPVAVHLDQYGVPSFDCQTDEDCAAALGYFHARDRFEQMEFRRRFSTGRLTDVVQTALAPIADGASLDARALFTTRDGRPAEEVLLETADDKTRGLLDAYANGVNAWISDVQTGKNGTIFPEEFSSFALGYTPDLVPPWTPSDSIATVLALIENLTNDEGAQISATEGRLELGDDDRFLDLFSRRPIKESSILEPGTFSIPSAKAASDAFVAPSLRHLNMLPALKQYRARLDANQAMYRLFGQSRAGDAIGSNNWVIGPDRTVNGSALLSNDPHLGMTNPATWYLAHLDAKTNGTGDIHAAGVTFAGLPFIIIGQNEDIAWGATTTVFDFTDVYEEELVLDDNDEPKAVMFQGEEVDLIKIDFDLPRRDGTKITETYYIVPHHGPLRAIDIDNRTALSLRWTGQDVDTDINFPVKLNVATSVMEAREALRDVTSIGQNWVVIDTAGNFGWFPFNRLPNRDWATFIDGPAPPWLVLDGAGDYEWETYLTTQQLPQVFNPELGYVATANNDMTGALFDGDPTNDGFPPLQVDGAAGYRHARIVQMIEDIGDQHTTETMTEIVSDVHSLIGEDMTFAILSLATDKQTTLTPNAVKVAEALLEWNFQCPSGLDGTNPISANLVADAEELLASSGCAAFHVVINELEARILNDEPRQGGRGPDYAAFYSIMDPKQLNDGDTYWDNLDTKEVETKYDIVGAAFAAAGDFLVGKLGSDETQWAWGRIHTLTLQSDLASFGLADYNNPPPPDAETDPIGYANNGGLFTVDVANPGGAPEGAPYGHGAGPSTRFVCEGLAAGMSCTISLPGGQSGHVDDVNYDSLLQQYLANESIPVVMDIGAAAADAVETVTLD